MLFRFRWRGPLAMLTACALAVVVLAVMGQAASAFVPCPSAALRSLNLGRWETLWGSRRETAKGVTMCRGMERSGIGTLAYLQIVDTNDGAKIRLHAIEDRESENGFGTNPDTLYRKKTVRDWYTWLRGVEPGPEEENWSYRFPENSRLFSVTNATFFTDTNNERDTTVPFPLWTWGSQDSWGLSWRRAHPRATLPPGEYYGRVAEAADEDYEAPKKVLEIGEPTEAIWHEETEEYVVEERIQPVRVLPFQTFYEWDYETIMYRELMYVGGRELDPDTADLGVGFAPEYRVGTEARRNYVGTYEGKVYILTTMGEFTNARATSAMEEIQAGMDVVQMDGGGSASFYSEVSGGAMSTINPLEQRRVASVLAIYRAP